MSVCDFFLFQKVKITLKGMHVELVEDVKTKTAELSKRLTADGLYNTLTNLQCFVAVRMRWYQNVLRLVL